MEPIVKWAGGKRKLLPVLLAHVPQEVRTYVEPFAGGASLFFALMGGERKIDKCVLADQNEDLITLYRVVKDKVGALIRELTTYRYEETFYYEVRDRDPRRLSDVKRAARILYLNKTCYNGLWRVNSRGKFNVPFGRYTNPRILDIPRLESAAKALARATLLVGDFEAALHGLSSKDFVYFDPPYVPVSKTSNFTDYAVGGFHAADQERLRRVLLSLRNKGVRALLSNADSKETRDLYKDFPTQKVTMRRNINSKVLGRGNTPELLVTTWSPS